jgi:hypothetical protein
MVGRLVSDLTRRRSRTVFLKQFYDHADGGRACYQAIVRAEVETTEFRSAVPLLGDWELRLESLDSHPIGRDLGLSSGQPSLFSCWIDFDFVYGNGETIWRAQ